MGSAFFSGGKRARTGFPTRAVSSSHFCPAIVTGFVAICVRDVAGGLCGAIGGKWFANPRSTLRHFRRRLAFVMMTIASQGQPTTQTKMSK